MTFVRRFRGFVMVMVPMPASVTVMTIIIWFIAFFCTSWRDISDTRSGLHRPLQKRCSRTTPRTNEKQQPDASEAPGTRD
jgi:hypothetical protein